MPLESGTEIRHLNAAECWERLRTHPAMIGRVGTGGPSPDILPVNYVVDGTSVVFRTAQGKKLAAIGRGERVVFEDDHADRTRRVGWSVIVHGIAEEIWRGEELEVARDLPLHPWAPGERDHYLRIVSTRITGRVVV